MPGLKIFNCDPPGTVIDLSPAANLYVAFEPSGDAFTSETRSSNRFPASIPVCAV